MKANEILQGDVLAVAKTLLARSINCIVTSPPYYGLRDYGLPKTHWPEVSYSPMAGLPALTIPATECCLGLEDSIEAYVAHMVLVFRRLWRVLRDDGTAWLNLGDSYANSSKGSIVIENSTLGGSKTYQANGTPPNLLDKTKLGLNSKNLLGIPWRIAFALQADGWYLRSDIIWHKKNPMPESCGDRPTNAHEHLFLLAKSAKYYYDSDAIKEPFADERMGNHGKYTPHYQIGSARNDGNQVGANGEWDGSGKGGRNKRSVWSLSSRSYKGAHFAVFPPKLIEPCILAGCPAQVCVECGEPWVRVVEKGFTNHDAEINSKYETGSAAGRLTKLRQASRKQGREYTNNKKTIAFVPTCQCDASTLPGIVLDPFLGSGTTAQVAIEKNRRWLGVELNPEYVELAIERLHGTQPELFGSEGV